MLLVYVNLCKDMMEQGHVKMAFWYVTLFSSNLTHFSCCNISAERVLMSLSKINLAAHFWNFIKKMIVVIDGAAVIQVNICIKIQCASG